MQSQKLDRAKVCLEILLFLELQHRRHLRRHQNHRHQRQSHRPHSPGNDATDAFRKGSSVSSASISVHPSLLRLGCFGLRLGRT